MQYLSIDFETSAIVDVKKHGASRHSRATSTIVTVIAWRFGTGPVKSVVLPGRKLPKEIEDHIRAGGIIRAWNASYEIAFLENYFGVPVDPAQVQCTMQRALYAGLPASLDQCGDALGLDIVKDKEGKALMMRMARPRAVDPLRWWHDEDPEKLERLRLYCEQDVRAESAISDVIPLLPDDEVVISILDRKANAHGIRIDRRAVRSLIDLAAEAGRAINAECAQITNGAVTSPGTQTQKLAEWLGEYAPPDLSAESVADALKRDDLPDHKRRTLELRRLAAKSSVKKLNSMLSVIDDDDCARGMLQYYGASRTGRFSGRLIQPQNFPRPSIKNPEAAIDDVVAGASAEYVETFYGPALDVVASCLRGMLIPRPGKRFVVYDLAQIEARAIAWCAGQSDAVKVFRDGGDIYTHAQHRIGLNSRQEGKVATLGLSYGMGARKFVDTAKTYGLAFTEERAQEIVTGWRKANSKIVSLWYDADRAIKEAISTFDGERPVTRRINVHLSVTVRKAGNGSPLMTMRLPSGRMLFYRDIALTPGERGDEITYAGVGQVTKKWERIRSYGPKFIENAIQALSRDIICAQIVAVTGASAGELLLSVHDELIFEVDADRADAAFKQIGEMMRTAPPWAKGLPVGAEGHVLSRYGK